MDLTPRTVSRPGAETRPVAIGRIDLSLAAPDDLFNALDPSPLVSRDLDDEVEAYIVESARELPQRAYALAVHFAGPPPAGEQAAALAQAIRAYFLYRCDVQARRLWLLMREGRQALAVGLVFLAMCGSLGVLANRLVPGPFGGLLNEGLLIVGWVANWRPIEIFLYDWRPMRHRRDILAGLARMEISFRER